MDTTSDKTNRLFTLLCLLLALGTAALYWPITSHPFILFDDEDYITGNAHVTSGLSWTNFVWAFTTTHAANWHPLTWLSHQADCTLFGLNAGGHHLVSLLLHAANALLVFLLLRGATGATWRSALVAAFFAWHPLRVESVAWASERKDVLSTFFFLLTLIAYVRYADGSKVQSPKAKAGIYLLALFLFALGLMSKPMVVTLPFVLLLLDFWPLQRISYSEIQVANYLRLLAEKIPFFALAAAGCAVTYLVQTDAGATWPVPLYERIATAVLAYARYVADFFWPVNLAIVYAHPRHWPAALAIIATVALAAWTFLCVRNWRKSPFLAVGWFWFLGTLVPTIGVVQVGAQYMADRYTYIPSIGFFIALVWGAAQLLEHRPEWNRIFRLLAGGALAGCLVMTSIQISYWRDNISLFLHAIEVTQDNYVADNCLGKAFEMTGQPARALVLYRASVKAEPRYPQSQFNLAMTLLEFGDTAGGLKHLQDAAALQPRDPDIQYNLGLFFSQHGSWTNAATCFSNCLALRPDFAPAQCYYGSVLANLGRFAEAAPHFRQALRLQPDFSDAQTNLNRLLASHPELK